MRRIALHFAVAALLSLPIFAQPAGWSDLLSWTIQEGSGATLTNYQVQLTMNTAALVSAGLLQADGDDLRFGSSPTGATLYDYWIESGMNTASTIIWVEIPSLPANSETPLYAYIGNPVATQGSTLSTFIGPFSSTNQYANPTAGGVGNSQRGFRFSPNEPILATQFGKFEPTGTTRYVTLFDFGTQAILRQTQVSGPAATYTYQDIAPLWLTSGTQYTIQLYQGAADGYYFSTSSQVNSRLTYHDMRYCNSCTQNTFPTNVLSNYHYGYSDFTFYARHAAVTPAPLVIGNTTVTGAAGSVSFTESGPPVLLDDGSDAVVTDPDSVDFDTGNVTATISANRVSTEDVLSVRNQGIAPGEIGVSGAVITYNFGSGPVTIGTMSGGSGTSDLVITLNANANTTATQALIRNLTYTNTNTIDPDNAARTIGITVNDGDGNTSAVEEVTVSILDENDAPTLSGGPYELAGTDDTTTSSATLVSTILAGLTYADADPGAASGIAVTATSGNGTWQYSTDGVTWNSFGIVAGNAALLLSSTTSVRYIPEPGAGETATFTFRAWDQTSGTASTNSTRNTADTTTNGGATAFSTGTAQATLLVTAVVADIPALDPRMLLFLALMLSAVAIVRVTGS